MSKRRTDANPRRLVFWTDSFWPRIGGGESWSLRLLRDLTRRGYELRIVEVGHADQGRSGQVEGMPILRVGARRAFEAGDAAALADFRRAVGQFLEGFTPDLTLVSAYGAEALVMLSLMGSRLAAPQMAVLHAEWPAAHLAPQAPAGRLLDRAARIVVFDPAMAQWLAAAHPSTLDKQAMVDLAVADSGPPVPRPGQGLLFCGRFVEQKGGDLAIAAFARVAAQFPAATLTVAGEGPLAGALQVQAKSLGLTRRVRFVGAVPSDAMAAQFDAAAMVLAPSRFEPFGLVAVEAALRARPVVASAVGGLRRIVEDGVTGLLCPPNDAEALAAACLALLEDPARADAMGAAARESVLGRFDWAGHVMSLERLMAESAACEASNCAS